MHHRAGHMHNSRAKDPILSPQLLGETNDLRIRRRELSENTQAVAKYKLYDTFDTNQRREHAPVGGAGAGSICNRARVMLFPRTFDVYNMFTFQDKATGVARGRYAHGKRLPWFLVYISLYRSTSCLTFLAILLSCSSVLTHTHCHSKASHRSFNTF